MMTREQVEENLEALRKQANDSPTSLAAKQALINGLEFEYAALRTELAAVREQVNHWKGRFTLLSDQLSVEQARVRELQGGAQELRPQHHE